MESNKSFSSIQSLLEDFEGGVSIQSSLQLKHSNALACDQKLLDELIGDADEYIEEEGFDEDSSIDQLSQNSVD